MRTNSSRLLIAGGVLLAGAMLGVGSFYFAPQSGTQTEITQSTSPAAATTKSSSPQDQTGNEVPAQPPPASDKPKPAPPYEALALALQISDPVERQKKLHDLLSQWAESDPEAALQWARTSPQEVTEQAISAVFDGTAKQPALALKIGRELLAYDAANGNPHGAMLVGSLTRAGNYTTALQLVQEAPADVRADWTTAIFTGWAQTKPMDALKSVASMTDPAMRQPAFNALVDSWASDKAADLAAYSTTLPPGPERNHALSAAMDKWSLQDPAAASEWINNLPPSAELDQGIAWIVTRTDGANRPPDIAVGWAENISDPALRLSSVTHVVQEWAASNPTAARQYVLNASWLTADQRAALLQSLVVKP